MIQHIQKLPTFATVFEKNDCFTVLKEKGK